MNNNWTHITQQASFAWSGLSCLDQMSLRDGVRVPGYVAVVEKVRFDMNKTIVDHAPGGSSG